MTLRRPALAALVMFGLLPYVSTIKWPPIPSFWAEWICALLAAAVAISLRQRSRPEPATAEAVPIPLAALACAVGAMIVLAQLLVHQPRFSGAAWLAFAEVGLAAIVCIAGARLRSAGTIALALDAWALGLLIALAFNAAEVLVERSGWQVYIATFIPRPLGGRTGGLFGQPNQLASFAAMAWCAAQYLWLRGKLPWIWLLAFAAATGIVNAGASSRAGVVVWACATLLGWLALRWRADRRERRWWLVVSVGVFIVVQGTWALMDRGAGSDGTVFRGDTRQRVELLRDAWQLMLLHPLTGVGFDNFRPERWLQLSSAMLEPAAEHPHNLVLHLAVEFGVVGAVMILLPLVYCVYRALRSALLRDSTAESFFIASILVIVGGYSLSEYPLWYTFFLLPCALVLGLVEQPTLQWRPVQSQPMKVLRSGAWALALLAALALAYDYRRIESLYTNSIVGELTDSRAAVALKVPANTARQIATWTVFDTYGDLMLSRTLILNGRLMADKTPITERVMLAFPNWETVSRHITFLVAAEKDEEARAVWDKTSRNHVLRTETYEALQRNVDTSPRLAEFFAKLSPPALAAAAQP